MNGEMTAALCTDAGRVREANEDACRIVQPGDSVTQAARGVLAVVADGMGGHSGGEVASQMAVETIHRSYYAAAGEPGPALLDAVMAANRTIFARAAAEPELKGMGTTCVALVCCGDAAYIAHVGDSRLYLVRGDGIYQMTNDDSAVGEMVQQGLLTRGEARRHQDRNVLLRALGTHAQVNVAQWNEPFPIHGDDTFVLCSDGLTDLVADEEILAAVRDAHVTDACRALVELAKTRGGFDNITVAMLRFAPQPADRGAVPKTREFRATTDSADDKVRVMT